MSLYDIAVKTLGFPTIELFVKVSMTLSKFSSNYNPNVFEQALRLMQCPCMAALVGVKEGRMNSPRLGSY